MQTARRGSTPKVAPVMPSHVQSLRQSYCGSLPSQAVVILVIPAAMLAPSYRLVASRVSYAQSRWLIVNPFHVPCVHQCDLGIRSILLLVSNVTWWFQAAFFNMSTEATSYLTTIHGSDFLASSLGGTIQAPHHPWVRHPWLLPAGPPSCTKN